MFNFLKPKPKIIKSLGQLGEEFAQEHYKSLGYKIIAKNEYNKKGKQFGEIDFITKDKTTIIFVEVKTRSSTPSRFGTAAEAVDIYKQRKILKAVKIYFLHNREYSELRPQIDVCLVEYSEVDKSFKSAKIISNAVEDCN
jgi:putative endonuclease